MEIYIPEVRGREVQMQFNVTVDRDVCDLDDLHGMEPACHVFVPGRNSTFASHISSIIVVRAGSWKQS
jgi:hypothetical protein